MDFDVSLSEVIKPTTKGVWDGKTDLPKSLPLAQGALEPRKEVKSSKLTYRKWSQA
jgi:hypothetical protein